MCIRDRRCATAADGSVACSYTASDFLAFANVRAFVDRVDGWDDLLELVPSRVDVAYDPALVAGSTGRGGGLVAFALYNGNGVDGTRSSFLVVAAQDGELLSVVSTTDKDRGEMSTHFDPVKVVDPDTLVTMSNDFMNEDGYAYVWSWKDDEDRTNVAGDHLRRLNDKIIFSSHDIQLEAGDDAYWQSTGAHLDCVGQCGTSFSLIDAATGGIRKGVEVDNCRDVNAVQVVADAAGAETAYVSCRLYNSVNAIDVATGATKWIAGGDYGLVGSAVAHSLSSRLSGGEDGDLRLLWDGERHVVRRVTFGGDDADKFLGECIYALWQLGSLQQVESRRAPRKRWQAQERRNQRYPGTVLRGGSHG